MRVLWIIGNINDFPEAAQLLTGENVEIKSTGGWLSASAKMLVADGETKLAVAASSSKVNEFVKLQGKSIIYYILPDKGKSFWKQLKEDYKPDVIHIHGTEMNEKALHFLDECGAERTVLSMQGVLNAISKYIYSGISFKDKITNVTFHDLVRRDFLFSTKRIQERAKREGEIISRIHHVIGRTTCDRAYAWAINPNVAYHFCNETLRDEFYTGRWSFSNCCPYTIFLSQASRPLKGFHFLLRALPIVLKKYPNTRVRVAGDFFTKASNLKERIRLRGYGKFINKEIHRLNLNNVIEFIGPLNAEGIKQECLQANLFVNTSTIENSPNSLCEAQILGVPCLSSYVGGVPDMMPNVACGEMYRFDEIEILAFKICDLFEKSSCFDNTIMREVAMKRHDPKNNMTELKSIYDSIINDSV